MERALAPVDLSPFDDLELWVRCDRVADGSEARPFFLELRLGSAALAAGASGNAWHRLIPVTTPDVWQAVPLALDDLAAAVRGAVTQIRLTCVDASAPFALELDRITALRSELLADVDAALVARLGAAAPAVVLPAAPEPAEPFFRITSYGVRPAPERSPASGFRSDFTGQGFSIRPPSIPFDLFYAVDAVDRGPRRRGQAARVRVLGADADRRCSRSPDVRSRSSGSTGRSSRARRSPGSRRCYLKVSAAQRATAAREAAVPPFNRVDVEADTRAVA